MTKNRFFLTFLVMIATVLSVFATPNEIVVHSGNGNVVLEMGLSLKVVPLLPSKLQAR